MEEKRRLTLEEIDRRHPRLIPALREHPHVGWILVRSEERGPLALGGAGSTTWPTAGWRASTRWRRSPRRHRGHLLRTDGFAHVADIMVGSFYDPQLDEACAFEELISFHGGLGGLQTRAFILYPVTLPPPAGPIIGAAAVHGLLSGWRSHLQAPASPEAQPAPA